MTISPPSAPETLNGSQEAPPDGFQWVLVPENRPEGARLVRTLAWRIYEDEEVLIDALSETFRSKRYAESLRWLLEQPEVRKVMFERIRGAK